MLSQIQYWEKVLSVPQSSTGKGSRFPSPILEKGSRFPIPELGKGCIGFPVQYILGKGSRFPSPVLEPVL